MGAWGIKPLENDGASDLRLDFEESNKDISILENIFDIVLNMDEDEYLESIICEQAVASAQILNELSKDDIPEEDQKRLSEKSNKVLKRVLEKSELQELWEESGDDYKEWVKSLEELIK